jgi:predicted TIM-barrel fold metal-dependent hydrolase
VEVHGLRRVAGWNRGPLIDTSAHDVPLPRKIPALFQHLALTLPPGDPRGQRPEEAKLPDLIHDMDRAGVSACLVVLSEEMDEFFSLAARHPGRLFGLAYFDSLSPHQGLERVRTVWNDHRDLILGVRTAMPILHQDPRLRDFVPFYQFCLERGLPVQFHLGGNPGEAVPRPMPFGVLAASYPRLRIVCVHSGVPWHPDLPGLLRRFPNLFVAALGSPGADAEANGGSRTLLEFLRRAGSRQLMFGSNWLGRDPTYLQAVEPAQSLPWRLRRNVCWRTAAQVYGTRILGARTTQMDTSPTTTTR